MQNCRTDDVIDVCLEGELTFVSLVDITRRKVYMTSDLYTRDGEIALSPNPSRRLSRREPVFFPFPLAKAFQGD